MKLRKGGIVEYTKFGEELRVLRTRRHQSMKQMADVLGVTKSFLSAVETGRKRIPEKWIDILTDYYHLKPYRRQLLEQAAEASKSYIKIYLNGMPCFKRDLAVSFERSFVGIDSDTAVQIKKLIHACEPANDQNQELDNIE